MIRSKRKKVLILMLLLGALAVSYTSGMGTEEVREFSGVKKLVFNCWGTLYLEQGDKERLTIDAGNFILTKLKTEVHGETLYISVSGIQTGTNLRNIKFYLSLLEVEEITTHSSGKVLAGPIAGEQIELRSESSGRIEVESLDAGRLYVTLQSSGDITIHDGSVGMQSVAVKSSGKYDAGGLKSGAAEIRMASSGDAVLWVTGSLDAVLLSSGDLSYWGEPELVRGTAESSGDIRALGKK